MLDFKNLSKELSLWNNFFIYNPASRHRRRIIHSLIKKYCSGVRTVVDVGCGDGRMLEELHSLYGFDIYGIEPNPSSASERLGDKLKGFFQIDIENASTNRKFDLVIMTEVLEHLKNPENAIHNISKMCDKYLLITVPAGPIRKTDIPMGHTKHYTTEEILILTEQHGFCAVRCFLWGFPFHTFYRRLLDIFPGKALSNFGCTVQYGLTQKILCNAFYIAFFLNSNSKGTQLFYIGKK